MTSPKTEYTPSGRMSLYEPVHQIGLWERDFDSNTSPESSFNIITGAETKLEDKIQKRLVQNREAARKSRMRKKAYVQQLEMERLKLAQLEIEMERVRQHGLFTGTAAAHVGVFGSLNSSVSAFDMEYAQWVDVHDVKISELRHGFQSGTCEAELQLMVQSILNHYSDLFGMKREAARIDAFYVVSGMWRTSVERFFLWIGGFQPSELITIVRSHLETVMEDQISSVESLRHSCVQAEDALTQGMDKLQQTLSHTLAYLASGAGSYSSQTAAALDQLESLEGFVQQADHLREQTLRQMSRILTVHQAAMGLIAFGDYFQRLRALSSLWNARCPREMD